MADGSKSPAERRLDEVSTMARQLLDALDDIDRHEAVIASTTGYIRGKREDLAELLAQPVAADVEVRSYGRGEDDLPTVDDVARAQADDDAIAGEMGLGPHGEALADLGLPPWDDDEEA